MKYRIRVDAILDATDTATRDAMKTYLVALRDKMQRIGDIETSSIVVEQCYHDENPPKPCVILYKWEKK